MFTWVSRLFLSIVQVDEQFDQPTANALKLYSDDYFFNYEYAGDESFCDEDEMDELRRIYS